MAQNIQEPSENCKRYNVHATGKAGEERLKGVEEVFDIMMAEDFPKLITDTKP